MTPPTNLAGQLRSDMVREALTYWQGACADRSMPSRADIRAEDLVGIMPSMILMDVLRGPLDFRYRLIGTRIEEFMAAPYTGKRMSEIPHQAEPSTLWQNCADTVTAAAPVLGDAPYVGPRHDVVVPEALLMPLSDDDAKVNMLMVVVDYFRRAEGASRMPGT